jgi:hypothetical protein
MGNRGSDNEARYRPELVDGGVVPAGSRQTDPTAWMALVFALVVGFLSAGMPVVVFLFSLMPDDSCASGSCGFHVRGATVGMAVGLLAEFVMLIAVALLKYQDQRGVRWLCALAAPAMPWLALLILTGS